MIATPHTRDGLLHSGRAIVNVGLVTMCAAVASLAAWCGTALADQALLVGSGSSGAEITQLDSSSGAVGSISPSGFVSFSAVAFAPGTGGAAGPGYVAARGSDPTATMELIPIVVGASGPVAGTPVPIPNADYPGGAPSTSPLPSAVAVSSSGETAYVVDETNGVVFPVNDLASGSPSVGTPISGFFAPVSAAISPDGSRLYVLDDNGVEVIDTATDMVVATVSVPTGTPASMALAPDGSTAYVTSFTGGAGGHETLYAAPLTAGSTSASVVVTLPFSGSDGAQTIAIAPNGDTAYVEGDPALSSSDQTAAQVAVVDLSTDSTSTIVDLGTATSSTAAEAYGLAITSDGGTVIATESCTSASGGICANDGAAYPISTATNAAASPYPVMGTPLAIALPPAQPLGGTGTGPGATLGATGLTFGSVPVGGRSGSQPVSLTNTGQAPLAVSAVALSGSDPGDFAISSDGCTGQTLAVGASCAVSVDFAPVAAGARSGTLNFSDSAGGSPQTVTLTGTGAAPGAPIATGPAVPPSPRNGTGTVYGLVSPPGTEITLYRGSSSTPVYEGIEGHVFAYTGSSHVESYGPQGQYEISGLAPGTYRIEGFSFATGDVDSVSQVTLSSDEVARSDITLSSGTAFTGGLSMTTGFASQGRLPMALVGIPFDLKVPVKVTAAPPGTLETLVYTLSFGPETTDPNEASTATYDIFVYFNSRGVPEFVGAEPASSPAPTRAFGTWELGQAAAGLTFGQPLRDAAAARSAHADPATGGVSYDVFNAELAPQVSDGGTENVSVKQGSTVYPDELDPLSSVYNNELGPCPPGTTPVQHTVTHQADKDQDQLDTELEQLQDARSAINAQLAGSEMSDEQREALQTALAKAGDDIQLVKNEISAPTTYTTTYYECVPGLPQSTGSVYIDPSGRVTTSRGVPVADAKVVLEHATSSRGPFRAVAKGSALMSPANRRSPDSTDALGLFGWEVAPGYYKVLASAPGCHAASKVHDRTISTKVLDVPPPVTGINLKLTCPKLTRAVSTITLSEKAGSQAVTVRVGGRRKYTPLGTVTVKLGTRTLAEVPLIGGRALIRVTGSGKLTARYSGDGHYAPSTAHRTVAPPAKPHH